MQITSVSITYGRKINLGDYNNANIEVTLGATLEPTDSLHDVMAGLWNMAKANVKAQALPLVRQGKPMPEETHLGWQQYVFQPEEAEETPTVHVNGFTNGNHA